MKNVLFLSIASLISPRILGGGVGLELLVTQHLGRITYGFQVESAVEP